MPIYKVKVESYPDPSIQNLVARYGNVKNHIFASSEQLLRIISNQAPSTIRASIRFHFHAERMWQERTDVSFAFHTDESQQKFISDLLYAGPLSGLYLDNREDGLGLTSAKELEIPERFRYMADIQKLEEGLDSDEQRRFANPDIPHIYYNVFPFECREENDWLMVDRILDHLNGDCMIEIVVNPADITKERQLHYEYITQLMQVNQVGSDLDPELMGLESELEDFPSSSFRKVRDPIADEVLREHEELHTILRKPQLEFAIRCWAESEEDLRLVSATVAESCFNEGKYHIKKIGAEDDYLDEIKKAVTRMEINHDVQNLKVWGKIYEDEERQGLREFKRFAHLASVEELKSVFRLPVPDAESSPRTFRRVTDVKPVSNTSGTILIGDDLEIGSKVKRIYPDNLEELFSESSKAHPEIRFDRELLKKHMFIAGVPGSGKTTAMFNLLVQFAHFNEDVPFLVIEPAKTEYRTIKALRNHPDPVLKKLAESMKVFSVGNDDISPFRFNPLAYPEGISLDEHIGAVLTCFEAAMPMGGPLQGLLAEAVEAAYENPKKGRKFPRLKDVFDTAKDIVDSKGYEGEVLGNLKAALDVRLGMLIKRSIGKVFDCDVGVPYEEGLFNENVVLEMDYLTTEQACLMSLFILTSMREHIRVHRRSGSKLKHVTVLEEAHNIVGKSGNAQASEGLTDPKAFAAEYVSRMLAELRALGEGIIIADQLPSAVAPEVIKNTGTKLIHRIVAKEDREMIGGTMLLDGAGTHEMARMQPGEAFFFSEGMYRPRKVKALGSHIYMAAGEKPDKDGQKHIPEPPGNKELPDTYLQKEKWFNDARESIRKMEISDCNIQIEKLKNNLDVAENYFQEIKKMILNDNKNKKALAEFMHKAKVKLKETQQQSSYMQKWIKSNFDYPAIEILPDKLQKEIFDIRELMGLKLIPKVTQLSVVFKRIDEVYVN